MAMVCNNIQSSSSSSWMTRKYYDAFVSFRGKDTRYNFISHLFGALQRKGIVAFRDDTKLNKGESIAPELEKAIEGSQIFIVVFSKNYASSTWCLRELVKILDCVQVSEKRVLPIFYDVDPSVVRKQSEDYEKAFAQYEERFKDDLKKMVEVKRWREALTQVANLSGWDIRNKQQYEEIEKIVGEIVSILSHNFSSLPNDIVGIQSPLEELEKLLLLNSIDDVRVRVVGICGMGGIGKTTLVTTLYDRISHQYDACCLIDDVSKIYQHSGALGVQKQLLGQTIKEENLQICNVYNTANLIRSRLRHIRAFIVLDNVDQVEQLEKLALNREWLGAGSRIILICRDEHILNEYGVDEVYKIPLLNWDYSTQLFCRKAFKCDYIMTDYEKLTHDVLYYANGLPLAIKVLGSFLFGRDVSEWESALARLRDNPSKDIMDVLRLSFDGLEEMEKEIFLDIACFFNGFVKQYVENILNCCGFHANIGIRVLCDKSLVSISRGRISMHNLLQELGRKIVQENSIKESRKWSRLWLPNNFYNIMTENMEGNVEAIVLPGILFEKEEVLMAETLSKMSHLRLLILYEVKLSGSLNCLSNKLRYLMWHYYPFKYLPTSFQPNQLVELILKNSNIKQLWQGKKYLPNLRILDLSDSQNLIKMPNFEGISNLEKLDFEGCVKLLHVHPSIGLLKKLTFLNLHHCISLVSIPNNILGLSSLNYLNLYGCEKVFNNPMHVEHLTNLDTSETMLHYPLMSSIFKWLTLPFHFLYPIGHKDSGLTSYLSPSLPSFSCLCELDISFCNLSQIPYAIGSLHCLSMLDLGGNNFVSLPSFKELSKLVCLNLEHCKQLKFLPELPSPTKRLTYCKYKRHRGSGLYIFNCPELGEREHYSCMAFSWMIRLIQATEESYILFDDIDIVIPGSEIPCWFNNQGVDSSISIDHSSMYDNNCIGLCCCVVFVAHNDPTTLTDDINRRSIWISIGWDGYAGGAWVPVLLDGDLIKVESDHRWFTYFSLRNLSHFTINGERRDINNFKMKIVTNEVRGVRLEVKRYGYRWVYKKDLELFNVTMMHSGNSSARKRKFLAIEDEARA